MPAASIIFLGGKLTFRLVADSDVSCKQPRFVPPPEPFAARSPPRPPRQSSARCDALAVGGAGIPLLGARAAPAAQLALAQGAVMHGDKATSWKAVLFFFFALSPSLKKKEQRISQSPLPNTRLLLKDFLATRPHPSPRKSAHLRHLLQQFGDVPGEFPAPKKWWLHCLDSWLLTWTPKRATPALPPSIAAGRAAFPTSPTRYCIAPTGKNPAFSGHPEHWSFNSTRTVQH